MRLCEVSARSHNQRGRDTSKAGRVRNVLTPQCRLLVVNEPPGGNLLSCNAAGSTNPCASTEDSSLSTQCDAQSFETLVAAHTRSRRGGGLANVRPRGPHRGRDARWAPRRTGRKTQPREPHETTPASPGSVSTRANGPCLSASLPCYRTQLACFQCVHCFFLH